MHAKVSETVRRIAFQHSLAQRSCTHLDSVGDLGVGTPECLSCTAEGHPWVALRMCLTCGSIGCCDSSAGQHARGHFEATGHPVIRSIEPGQDWAWCYLDQAYLASAAVGPAAVDA